MILKHKKRLFVLVLAAFLKPVNSYGEIYRWVDENGRVHFSENAPMQQDSQEIAGKLGEIGNFFEFNDVLDVDWYRPPGEYKPAKVEVKIELVNYQLDAAEYRKIRDGVGGSTKPTPGGLPGPRRQADQW